jgi:hypothetical protein
MKGAPVQMVFLHCLPACFFFAFFASRTGSAAALETNREKEKMQNGETKQQYRNKIATR